MVAAGDVPPVPEDDPAARFFSAEEGVTKTLRIASASPNVL